MVRDFDNALESCEGGTPKFPDVGLVGVFEDAISACDELTWIEVVNGTVECCDGDTTTLPDVDIVGAFDDVTDA
jgi:hypothetical protein